jgi:eukaryotic-like serine/threonine-protein kinase
MRISIDASMAETQTSDSRGRRSSTQPLDAPQLLVGRVLDGRYRLDKVLNTGGMGIIFEATQLRVERRVAVKVLKPTLSGDPSLIKRFSLEVELVASLDHPNIVTLIDSGHDDSGLTYLVMEFITGRTFREALKRQTLTLAEIVDVFAQTCNALIETHARGIIHRDLKFDNIMLTRMRDETLHVRLLDFGVAKLLSRDGNLTQGGQVAGTPGIIAPELVDGLKPTASSDLYSIGVLLYTALAGEAPFSEVNDLALMRAHRFKELPDLAAVVGRVVPEALITLTCELLAKSPEARPSKAEDVRDRLLHIRNTLEHRFPNAPAYHPPQTSRQDSPTPALLFHPQGSAGDNSSDELIRKVFKQPVIAPMTVVTYLTLILIILVLVIIYLVYQLLGSVPA